MNRKPRKLNPRQRLFVQEFLIDLNATQAAIRAGYSKRTAQRTGSENLSKPLISAAIQAALQERMARVQVDATWVLRQQVRVYRRCIQDEAVVDKDGKPTGEYRFDAAGANRALENIGKHTNVNAFKGADDEGKPIDQNWQVTFVSVTKEEHDRANSTLR